MVITLSVSFALCFSSQVVKYLAGCGLQSCPQLLAKGYPDIGWNPCGGEKYLDFLRFAVFVNGLCFADLVMEYTTVGMMSFCLPFITERGLALCPPVGESVEENANVVVRLLIRRPECFGPALRGEGGNGLLAAMKEAIKISDNPAVDLPSSAQGVSSDA